MTDKQSPASSSSDASEKPITESPTAAANVPTTEVQVIKRGGGLSIFAILLSLAALAGSAFTWYQTQVLDVQHESRLAVGVSEIGAQVSRFGDAITRLQQDQSEVVSEAELDNRLQALATQSQNDLRTIRNDQEEMRTSMQLLGSELQRGVDQFSIEEVSQLLRLANNSLLFGADINAATQALNLADDQLKRLQDPRFSVVRARINDEIEALKAFTLPDIEVIGAELRALKKQVKSLPLANDPAIQISEEPVDNLVNEDTGFRSEMAKIWRDLIGSISIQRIDKPPKPLLAPEQRYFLDENIVLALSKAELALMQSQTHAWQPSLAEASQWLRDYYDLENGRVTAVLAQLDQLQQQNLVAQLPPITGSYQALQNALGGQVSE